VPPLLSRDRLGNFQRTKPPTFSLAVEPMDADDWLMFVEKKLQVVQWNNREKVLLASHQLSGPAADWWDAYVEAHKEPKGHQLARVQSRFPCASCSPTSDQAKEERVSRPEIGVHVCD
jgi:hypothetical protein